MNSVVIRRLANFIALVAVLTLCNSRLPAQQSAPLQSPQTENEGGNWQIETYFQGGFLPPSYNYFYYSGVHLHLSLDFYSAAFVVGRQFNRKHLPFHLSGRGEALLEVIPFWLARYPSQTATSLSDGSIPLPLPIQAQNFPGASVTPFLLRWNFTGKRNSKFIPWVQLGGGLLWTDHKFPKSFFPFQAITGGTSVINFTPQVGAGVNVFHRARQSADLAVKFIHISSAGLGDNNPGLNYTIQFAAGYSWWK